MATKTPTVKFTPRPGDKHQHVIALASSLRICLLPLEKGCRKLQCVTVKPSAGLTQARIDIWLLGFPPGFCGSVGPLLEGCTEEEWIMICAFTSAKMRDLFPDAEIKVEEWSATNKFQYRAKGVIRL